jgi:hypothetical protein
MLIFHNLAKNKKSAVKYGRLILRYKMDLKSIISLIINTQRVAQYKTLALFLCLCLTYLCSKQTLPQHTL